MEIKIVLIVLIILCSGNISAQISTKEIKINDKKFNTYELVEVSKKDKSFRQGTYKKVYWKDKVGISGQYSSNKKDGEWTFYNDDGSVYLTYNFTNDSILCFMPDTTKQSLYIDNHLITDIADRPVLYKEGIIDLRNFIRHSLIYPTQSAINGTSGKILIGMVIDVDGKVIDYMLLEGVDIYLNEEAMKVARSINGEWIPAIYQGRKVKSVYKLPLNFVLN